MPNYRSLVGGFFSSTPYDKSIPASIRTNNPGAINGAPWIAKMPGAGTTVNLDGVNHANIFETPEHGVAVWYELMRKYRATGAFTVQSIILRYGGGQANYATSYVPDVVKRTGLAAGQEIKLVGDDATLLKFAKAMFRHEAGRDTPLSDAQILHGFKLARGEPAAAAPAAKPAARSLVSVILSALAALFSRKAAPPPAKPAAPAVPAQPRWFVLARKDIGFHEVGANRGIERFIDGADGVMGNGKGVGSLGDPYCAIGVNYWLEMSGVPGTRSAMARSFENHKNFVRLAGPAIGTVATFWRGSPTAGTGHVCMYAGTDAQGRHLGLGANQSDSVNVSPMDMARHTGWWWPKGEPLPPIGAVRADIANVAKTGSEA